MGGYFLLNRAEMPETEKYPQTQETLVPENMNQIIYTDGGYSPQTLTIKKDETVTFSNQSSQSMWPASAMHPSHRVYDETSLDEHCPDTDSTAFDACAGILPNGNWIFKFNKIGDWKYHDHLSPSQYGTVVVEE